MSCGFGQRRHACKIVNLRHLNLSCFKGKAGPWVFQHCYWTWHRKAAQPMPVPASLQPSRRRVTLTMWIPPITRVVWLLGSKHEDPAREAASPCDELVRKSMFLGIIIQL